MSFRRRDMPNAAMFFQKNHLSLPKYVKNRIWNWIFNNLLLRYAG